MLDVFELIERIATAEATVLVTGESGTGKELAVRAIHRLSHRCDAPLLGCDCTALAPTLLESELFGHVKGSFSGAIATKKGLFEAADHGTLLLDEVSNLSMETQGKLLRVLETRCIRRVGDTAEREVDIRLIATTNRDLGQMVKVGQFRADLYYRLNVVPVSLPALRDRAGDIPLLAMAFLDEFSRQMGLQSTFLSPRALQQMEVYPWPGNVRELRNIVQRLAVLYGGSQIAACREGVPVMYRMLANICEDRGNQGDIELLEELSQAVIDASLCGLGKSAPNPVLSTLRYFRDEYQAHIRDRCCPACVCKPLFHYLIDEDICNGCGACKKSCPHEAIFFCERELP